MRGVPAGLRIPSEPFPRDPAADEARRELSRQIYAEERPSVIIRVLEWVLRQVANLFDQATGASPGGGVALVVGVLLVLAVVVVVLVWFGPLAGTSRRRQEAVEVAPTETGGEHRQRADAHAAAGRYADAVRERLRAVVAGLTERGLIDDRPGRTAQEIATEAGAVLPAVADELLAAATLFAEVWYGGRTATAAHDQRMREIDDRVAAARPEEPAAVAATPAWAVPGSGDSR